MENNVKPINKTALSILGFLCETPMSSQDIMTAAMERIGPFWSLTTSQVYAEIQRLEEKGLIKQASTGTYARRIFSVTPSGKEIFLLEINKIPGEETSRFQLLLFLKFGEFIEQEMLSDIITMHRASYAKQLRKYQKIIRDYPGMSKYDKVTLDFGIDYTHMVLKWLDKTESELCR